MIDLNIITRPVDLQPCPHVITRIGWIRATLQAIDLYVSDRRTNEMEHELFHVDYLDTCDSDFNVMKTCQLTIRTIYRIYGGDSC